MKPERLRAKLAIGEGQLDRGKGKTVKVFLPDCLRKHETLQAFGQLLSNLHRALQLDKSAVHQLTPLFLLIGCIDKEFPGLSQTPSPALSGLSLLRLAPAVAQFSLR